MWRPQHTKTDIRKTANASNVALDLTFTELPRGNVSSVIWQRQHVKIECTKVPRGNVSML